MRFRICIFYFFGILSEDEERQLINGRVTSRVGGWGAHNLVPRETAADKGKIEAFFISGLAAQL